VKNNAVGLGGLKVAVTAIWIEVAYTVFGGATGIISLGVMSAMSDTTDYSCAYTTEVTYDVVIILKMAEVILLLIGLGYLRTVNPFYRRAFKFNIINLIFVVTAVSAVIAIVVSSLGYLVLSVKKEGINNASVTHLACVVLTILIAVQLVSNVLKIIYTRNMIFGTRRVVDVIGNSLQSQNLTTAEKFYRYGMIVIAVLQSIGTTGVVYIVAKYGYKIIGEGTEAYPALYSAFKEIQLFLFMLIIAFIVSLLIRVVVAVRLIQSDVVIGKHVFSEEENAMLLEDRQAVIEGVKSNAK
jgi:membrane protein